MNGRDTDREKVKVAAGLGQGERRAGLRPIGEAATRIAAPIVSRQGGGVLARLKAEWGAIVGSDTASRSWPVKLGRDGALKLLVLPGFALDLQHRAPLVIERINLFFGHAPVARLTFVQGALPLTAFATPGAQSPGPASAPTRDDTDTLDSLLSGVDDPELRAALAGLGELVRRVLRQPARVRRAASRFRDAGCCRCVVKALTQYLVLGRFQCGISGSSCCS